MLAAVQQAIEMEEKPADTDRLDAGLVVWPAVGSGQDVLAEECPDSRQFLRRARGQCARGRAVSQSTNVEAEQRLDGGEEKRRSNVVHGPWRRAA